MIHGINLWKGGMIAYMCKLLDKEYSMSDVLTSKRNALSTIVPTVQTSLSKHGFEYTTNSKMTEIVVNTGDKNKVKSIINEDLDLSPTNFGVFLNICSSKKRVYIRQRVK